MISNLSVLETILSIIAGMATIISIYFGIKFYKIKVELVEKEKESVKDARAAFSNLVNRTDARLTELAYALADSRPLIEKSQLLVDKIDYGHVNTKAQLTGKPVSSLFSYRSTHFTAEKQLICKRFLHFMLHNEEIAKATKIFLLIDSGSTVFPLFGLLCDYYWNDQYMDILRRVSIFTNNIPGLSELVTYGRKGSDINAEMIYHCDVIPGAVEGKYSAILGEDGPTHLTYRIKQIRDEFKDGSCKFIALVTGNYISLDDGILWRGDYHGKMKNALIYNADYVFILSPLGKIFDYSKNEINDIIRNASYPLAFEKCYRDLKDRKALFSEIDDVESSDIERLVPQKNIEGKAVFLVTTKREGDDVYPISFLEYFNTIYTKLETYFGSTNILSDTFLPHRDSNRTIFQLKLFQNRRQGFLNYEFPHREIRGFMKRKLK